MHARIRAAFQEALMCFDHEFRLNCISLTIEETNVFLSTCEAKDKYYCMRISTAVLERIEKAWSKQIEHFGTISPPYSPNSYSLDMSDVSLVWLVLHELCHIHLSHFKLASNFGLVRRTSSEPKVNGVTPTVLHPLTPLCLELQADHEATEMLLGAHSQEVWQGLRQRVSAISGILVLIEIEDTKNDAQGRTHPKAATRIFQLLGHLAEMPLIRAQVHQDASLIPSEEELQAFAHEITIPCFFDAIRLAVSTGAVSIASDLGSPEDFFKDLEVVKLGDPSRYGELKTQGAREWAKLWPCNEALKPILGGHFTI